MSSEATPLLQGSTSKGSYSVSPNSGDNAPAPPNAQDTLIGSAVKLPHRDAVDGKSNTKPPVWAIDYSQPGVTTPLPAKCSRHSRADGVCCRELKGDERTLIDPDVVRDVVIGLSDGLTVPFALTAGLSSLGESKIVVLGGVAELIAGAISMGIGGFLASQAERDYFRYQRQQTSARVLRSCAGEMEREVAEVLSPVGVDGKTCRAVAKCLREVEVEIRGVTMEQADSGYFLNGNTPTIGGGSDSGVCGFLKNSWFGVLQTRIKNARDEEERNRIRWSKDVGLTAFLLKFGEGIEEVPDRRLYISALTIGMGYLLGGLIPLLPYFFIPKAQVALIYSCVITGIILLIFGAVKARVTGAGMGWQGYAWGAVSTLFVGGLAAGAAFGIVKAMEGSD